MMLLLDAGNSRIKWAHVENGAWLQQGAVGNSEWLTLQVAFAGLPQPDRILVSNVVGDAMAQCLRSLCSHWPVPVEFVQPQAEQYGVRNLYQQPGQLGSDRWAALIAAWRHVGGACLVVNCGTATTIDALSGRGEFLGGLIVPGLDLMRRSLFGNTALPEDFGGQLQSFPRTTADAVYGGMVRATLGAVRHQYLCLGAPGAVCVLSGGAASQLAAHFDLPVMHVDNLVLHGLQIMGEADK